MLLMLSCEVWLPGWDLPVGTGVRRLGGGLTEKLPAGRTPAGARNRSVDLERVQEVFVRRHQGCNAHPLCSLS